MFLQGQIEDIRCPASTPLPHRGLRNLSCDALTAAGIFWARVWRTRRFPTGLRNASYNPRVGLQFPCRALLHQWGKEDSPNCPVCNERESLGHIQSRCKILEKPRIAAHHMIWREILLQLFGLSGDEGYEHKWVIPSAVSADSHKELTVRERVLFIGTRFSNLYTSVDTPTRGRVVVCL